MQGRGCNGQEEKWGTSSWQLHNTAASLVESFLWSVQAVKNWNVGCQPLKPVNNLVSCYCIKRKYVQNICIFYSLTLVYAGIVWSGKRKRALSETMKQVWLQWRINIPRWYFWCVFCVVIVILSVHSTVLTILILNYSNTEL